MKFALCGVGAAILLIAVAVYFFMKGSGPFGIHLDPIADGTTVQFTFPGKQLSSPKFRVATPTANRFDADLTSGEIQIPNATIEFIDTTILPGRFKIRMGDTLFDVMPNRILVDGVDHSWESDFP